jgi:hypothetical protein
MQTISESGEIEESIMVIFAIPMKERGRGNIDL